MDYDDEMIDLYNEVIGLEAVLDSIGDYPCDPDAFRSREQVREELREALALYNKRLNLINGNKE